MSTRGASAYREAQLLDGRLRRLQARRERQKAAIDSAFTADLLAMMQAGQPWLRAMVRQSIANDVGQGALLAAIDAAEVALDPHERETDAPEPVELLNTAANDGNAEWGMPPEMAVREAEGQEELPEIPEGHYPPGAQRLQPPGAQRLRYPEPGEAATVLPSGEVVAAGSAP